MQVIHINSSAEFSQSVNRQEINWDHFDNLFIFLAFCFQTKIADISSLSFLIVRIAYFFVIYDN